MVVAIVKRKVVVVVVWYGSNPLLLFAGYNPQTHTRPPPPLLCVCVARRANCVATTAQAHLHPATTTTPHMHVGSWRAGGGLDGYTV